MKLSAILAPLIAAKVPHEIIMQTVEAWEAEQSDALERRRANDRERQERRRHVTSRDVTVTASSREGVTRGLDNLQTKSQAGKKKQESLGSSASADEPFERFWRSYPRREGPNPKKPARDRFARLVAKGNDPERLIAAAQALAAEHPAPTRFVPQAITWLNQERFDGEDALRIVGDEFCPEDWPNTRFLVIRYRQEHQTDPPRAVQGGKAGYLIPAEWVANSRQTRAANA